MLIRFFVGNGTGHGPIAQLVEHRADNAGVSGAIPLRPTNFEYPVLLNDLTRDARPLLRRVVS